MTITSKDNEIIKHIKKLKEKKYRDQYNEFIIEGTKMIEEALEEKAKIKSIIICDDCKNQGAIPSDLMYEIAKLDCIYVSEKVFNTITDVINPQGIMAVLEKPVSSENVIDYNNEIILALDGIQDPGNLGTILRTVDSIGLTQILVSKGTADAYNSKVIRSTMGAIFRVKVIETENLVKTIKEIKKHKITVYATDLRTDKSIYDIDYNKSAIIIGNEANGVSEDVLKEASERIKIPMLGKTESLNAAVATSVILYEAYRQMNSLGGI